MPPPRATRRPGFFRRRGVTLLFALAILAGGACGLFLAYATDLPQVNSLEDFRPNIVTQVFAADGSLLGEFAIENRVVVGFADIPPVLRNAIVSVEDAEFWRHMGINVVRIPAAAWSNLRSGRRAQGSSTLTMQLSRLLFLTPEKTYERKIKEALLAFQIEKNFTKEEIFTLYCNQVYFGHGNYGVEATSRFLFGKSAKELDLAEAALIAGLPQNPSRLSPIENPDKVRERRNHVLDRMLEEKYISPAEAQAAQAEPVTLRLRRPPPSLAPHFLEEVRKYLEREYGSQRIYQGGLRVETTLDPLQQRAAVAALRRGVRSVDRRARGFVPVTASALVGGHLPDPLRLDDWEEPPRVGDCVHGVVVASDRDSAQVRIADLHARLLPADVAWTGKSSVAEVLPVGAIAPFTVLEIKDGPEGRTARLALEQEPKAEAALLALDVKTGAVTAMVGGYDFARSKFNRATQAQRQVGSAFKPIVYAAALEQLHWTPATILLDTPVSFPSGNGGVWSPHDYDFKFLGPLPLRRALEQSRNVPAIRTLQALGVQTGIDYARKLGLAGPLPPNLPIAIGAGEATLMEMTGAFATFPNQGLRMRPYLISRITDREGNLLEETRPLAHDAIRADTAYLMTSLMRGVVERGTAVAARKLNRPIGGKTGTTDDWTDGWFIGYEPSLAAGVWVGFDDKRLSLGRSSDGARVALPIWMDFWEQATKGRPVEEYPVPGNIVFVPVDEAGRPASPGTEGVRMESFVAGTEPGARGGTP